MVNCRCCSIPVLLAMRTERRGKLQDSHQTDAPRRMPDRRSVAPPHRRHEEAASVPLRSLISQPPMQHARTSAARVMPAARFGGGARALLLVALLTALQLTGALEAPVGRRRLAAAAGRRSQQLLPPPELPPPPPLVRRPAAGASVLAPLPPPRRIHRRPQRQWWEGREPLWADEFEGSTLDGSKW